jgi:O-antigen/teichoic acid export membrane protein
MYHGSTQVMAALTLPMAAMLAFFAYDVMLLWTRNEEVARNTAPIVRILVAGTALNGMLSIPYALQLAHGWTRLSLAINSVFILIMCPAIYLLTTHYGTLGAASAWVGLNCLFVFASPPLTHRRLLKGEAPAWFVIDLGIPLLAALLAVFLCRILLRIPTDPLSALLTLAGIWLIVSAVTALATPTARAWLIALRFRG